MNAPKVTTGAQLDLAKYVHFLFIGGGFIATVVFYFLLHTVWIRFARDPGFLLVGAIALLLGAGLAVYLWRHERTNELARETISELSRVTWPTRQELSAATVVVIVTSIIVAILLGLFDGFWGWVTTLIY